MKIISISDNSMNNANTNITKNKSEYNLTTNPYKNYYLFHEIKKNYVPHYNYNSEKKIIKNNSNIKINNHSQKNIVSTNENNSYNNHSFIDIKEKSKNKENKNKLYKVQLQRKQLAKFYHHMGLRKYPYAKGKIETSNNTNNHKYTEIYENSGTIRNNINTVINTNKNYNNHRYSLSQYLPKNKNTNITDIEEKKDSDAKSRILKETSNTKLIEVKSPSKDINNNYNKNLYLSENKKNLFNNYSYDIKYDYNNNTNRNDNNYKYKVIRNVNNNIANNNFYKPELNGNNIYASNNFSNYNQVQNKCFTKYSQIPYSLISGNINIEQNNRYNNDVKMENENNMKKKLCILRNNRINNLNYNILKQKVRLSFLKKQMYEQKRNMLYNSNKNYNNQALKDDYVLYEKTRKLMDNNNY